MNITPQEFSSAGHSWRMFITFPNQLFVYSRHIVLVSVTERQSFLSGERRGRGVFRYSTLGGARVTVQRWVTLTWNLLRLESSQSVLAEHYLGAGLASPKWNLIGASWWVTVSLRVCREEFVMEMVTTVPHEAQDGQPVQEFHSRALGLVALLENWLWASQRSVAASEWMKYCHISH